MPEQLVFDWPIGTALRPEDFFVSDANRAATAMLTDVAGWPEKKLVIIGPEGSGKSHLTRVFQVQSEAIILDDIPSGFEPSTPIVIEDVDRLPQGAEEPLFHLHNAMRSAGLPLLLTARTAPSRWNIALPDLASRMQATTPVAIEQPDDMLLQVLIAKLFADRQVIPPPSVITYIAKRIERSYTAVADIVARLDKQTMITKTPANTKMAAALLDNTV